MTNLSLQHTATHFSTNLNDPRWGWVFLERTRILRRFQFTTHFIEFFVVETKRFVGSSVTVMLTRQTCGQRSSRAAESKRRALENYFPEQICCMFLMSKCRGDWDLGRCTFFVSLRKENCCAMAASEQKRVSPAWKIGIWHCAAVFFSQIPKKCTDLDFSLLCILILWTYCKFARVINFQRPAFAFRRPARVLVCAPASRSRLQNYRRIVSFPQQKIRWNAL